MLGGGGGGGMKARRGASSGGQQERVRTHLFFSSQSEHHTMKKKRRTHNKLQQYTHKKEDAHAQSEIDPSQWTGNQRVLHFGPMAQRDPYFYYYPKGWDVLYPAHFGFFPYRTKKFRGSSSVICTCAFGVFFLLGGAMMSVLGFVFLYRGPWWTWSEPEKWYPPPIQIAGPILFVVGALLVVLALICAFASSNFFKLHLHHTRAHNEPQKVTIVTRKYQEPPTTYEPPAFQPLPPPAYPVLANRYAHSSIVSPHAEMKLFPPVMPGYSTLSLHGRPPPPQFIASPYNTLRAMSATRYQSGILETGILGLGNSGSIVENRRTGSVGSRKVSSSQSSVQSSHKRSKSMGPLHRAGSGRSRVVRENSQA